jgi:hypothetical protein
MHLLIKNKKYDINSDLEFIYFCVSKIFLKKSKFLYFIFALN